MSNDQAREVLARCYTGVVNDVMQRMGLSAYILPLEITPLIPEQALCGPVFTIEGHSAEGADAHRTLIEWTGLLSRAKPGHIWLCQPHDRAIALMGELSAETLKARGVIGCVIDGNIRDVDFILRLNFQCWRRQHTPRDIVGRWLPSGFDVPITIGEVLIRPGDYLIGDRDGLIRVPRELAAGIGEEAAAVMLTENKVRKAILAGLDPREAYLTFGKF